ncbi:protein smoothened isoform X2 [Bacillus rossius redtenbacheri]
MCKISLGPCRLLAGDARWRSLLRCEDASLFPPMCKNDVNELKFNTMGRCVEPLVQTDNAATFYEGVDGCGVQCHDPLFTDDERRQIHTLVAWAASVCFGLNLFTVATFLINWRSANKYPAVGIFYINGCFLVAGIGWLAQFLPGAREDIVCRKDLTLRMSEPSAGENLSCVVVFVLVYYFVVAAMVWFVILAFAWHSSFQALGKIQERIDKKGAYFHMVAWSLPLVFTITTMALGEIDGSSMAGICFVGYRNHAARAGLLLVPLVAMLVVGGFFLLKGLLTLVRLKVTSQEVISEHANAKIRETIVRLSLFSMFAVVFVLATVVCHVYEFRHGQEWQESFREHVVCRITNSASLAPDPCRLRARPSVMMLQIHLLMFFSASVVMSSWVWTAATLATWRRFIIRKFKGHADEPVRLKKHRVIAQAFAKRKAFNSAGRVSISFHSTHDDPLGLNLDVNSAASQDLSSTWAAALPKLLTRRGALIGPTGSASSHSEISLSVRRVSVESRRHSLDSQVSVQIAEVTATRKVTATKPMPGVGGARAGRTSFCPRRRCREFGRHHSGRVAPMAGKGGGLETSETQLGAQILNTLALGSANIQSLVPNLMKRRFATAGLDGMASSQSEHSESQPDETLMLDSFAQVFNMVVSREVGVSTGSLLDDADDCCDAGTVSESSLCPELMRLAAPPSRSSVSSGSRWQSGARRPNWDPPEAHRTSCDVGTQVDRCEIGPEVSPGRCKMLCRSREIGTQTPSSVRDSGVTPPSPASQSLCVCNPDADGVRGAAAACLNRSYGSAPREGEAHELDQPARPKRRRDSDRSRSVESATPLHRRTSVSVM